MLQIFCSTEYWSPLKYYNRFNWLSISVGRLIIQLLPTIIAQKAQLFFGKRQCHTNVISVNFWQINKFWRFDIATYLNSNSFYGIWLLYIWQWQYSSLIPHPLSRFSQNTSLSILIFVGQRYHTRATTEALRNSFWPFSQSECFV